MDGCTLTFSLMRCPCVCDRNGHEINKQVSTDHSFAQISTLFSIIYPNRELTNYVDAVVVVVAGERVCSLKTNTKKMIDAQSEQM